MKNYTLSAGKSMLKAWHFRLLALLFVLSPGIFAQSIKAQVSDSVYYVHRINGEGVYALPDSLVKSYKKTTYYHRFYLLNDSCISFLTREVDSITRTMSDFPKFTSFKINNKYNYDLDNDVYCVIDGDKIYGDMGYMIGKDLRPSFETDREALVYVDTTLQQTRTSRVRFDKPVKYFVAGKTSGVVLDRRFVKAINNTKELDEIALNVDMLYTNAPTVTSNSLDKLVDGDPTTFYHCTSSADRDTYEVLPLDSCPCIEITLREPIREFAFFYQTRHDTDQRQPLAFNIYVSKNEIDWKLIASYDEDDGIPATGANATFLSPMMDAGDKYDYVKIEMTKSNYKNYLCLAELKLYQPYNDGTEPKKDYYQYFVRSLGREYTVDLSFRADKAEVPRIDINIDGGYTVTSRDYWLKGTFKLSGNGMYESVEDSVQIKGRGNSSWGWRKKPYTIKFAEKIKLCGLRKGKRWNLMSNYQDVTEMMNATIFKAGRMVRAPYQPHSIPIELYINGRYYGCYTLTEHIGIHNNCVDEDDFSQMLELDSYYDETYKFKSMYYNLPVNVKNPDLAEPGCPQTLRDIEKEWGNFEDVLRRGKDLSGVFSVDSFATFMLMNDLCGNTELNHPKSTFLYKPTGTSRYIFGPGWDFDWGFGYQMNGSYFQTYSYRTIRAFTGLGTTFFQALMEHEQVIEAYYKVWQKFIKDDCLDELLNWMDDYYAYAQPSYQHSVDWGWSNYSYASYFEEFKTWLRNRVEYIESNLTVPTGIDNGETPQWDDKEEMSNGMIVRVVNGMLSIESTVETTLNIYRVDGSKVGEIEVGIGENIYPLAPRGLTIINGKRIYMKPL